MMNDLFGDRMKQYEGAEAFRKAIPLLPICVRLDGKSFSSWTSGLEKPYDTRMHNVMVATTIALVQESNAVVGYTESDEISLILYSDTIQKEIYFGGRIQKITSVLAGLAAIYFNKFRMFYLPEYKSNSTPVFDCRVWNVPNKDEATNTVLWREMDATKNSIQSAAHHYYSHKVLMNKNTSEMQEMLHQKGINWNDYPDWFKRGTYVQRKTVETPFTAEEIDRLPPKHTARSNPDLTIKRRVISEVKMPSLSKIVNRVDVLFDGAVPVTE